MAFTNIWLYQKAHFYIILYLKLDSLSQIIFVKCCACVILKNNNTYVCHLYSAMQFKDNKTILKFPFLDVYMFS